MSPTMILVLVDVAVGIPLLLGFALYKLRFVIRKGYFQAEFVCDDGEIIRKTFISKESDSEFTMKIRGKLDTYHKIYKDVSNPTEDDADNPGKKPKQPIKDSDENDPYRQRIYRVGKFRIPKAYYIAHRSEPIDMLALKLESKVSATKYQELAKNTVTSQLLKAFTPAKMSEALSLILAVAVILGGILLLGYWMNSRIEQLMDVMQ